MSCMENTWIALAATNEVVSGASRKYALSLPAMLCVVCPRIPDVPDVMLCLYLLYQYYYHHAHTIKCALYDNIYEVMW